MMYVKKISKVLTILALIVQNTNIVNAQSNNDTSFLKLIFAGDIMGHDTQINSAYKASSKSYNYEPTFRYLKPYIETADIAIANLEVTLAGPPFKGYPCFSSPDALAQAALDAGFNVLLTANNHCLDRNKQGLERTIDVLDGFPTIYTGTFKDQPARDLTYPLIIEKNNIRLAILNYTYATNGIVAQSPNIVNYIDKETIVKDIQKAKLAKPDYIIVTLHWGIEYQMTENKQQNELAAYLLENGADAIIGGHPHVVQPIRAYYNNTTDSSRYNLVVYSMGNLVSNQRERYRNGGIMVELTLMKTDHTKIKDYNYTPAWVFHKRTGTENNFYIVPPAAYMKNKEYFEFTSKDNLQIQTFYEDTQQHLKDIKESGFFKDHCFK